MSWEALNWAQDRLTGSMGAKGVLMLLANYANQDGECFPSLRSLALRTEQSVDTVRRKIKELEARGLIERVEQWRDNGTRTVDRFRLLMHAKTAVVGDVDAADGVAEEGEEEVGGTLANCEGTLANCQGDPSNHGRGTLAPVQGQYIEPSLEPSLEPPPSPPVGGVARVSSQENAEEASGEGSAFSAFIAAYPVAPEHSEAEARRPWARMSHEERAKATLALPRYLDHCRAKKVILRAPASYLRSRIWEKPEFLMPPTASTAPARAEMDAAQRAVLRACGSAEDRSDWAFVAEGAPEWDLWRAAFARAGRPFATGRRTLVRTAGGGWEPRIGRHFPSERPPMPGVHDPPEVEGVGA